METIAHEHHHGEEEEEAEGEEEEDGDYSSVILVFTFMALTISFLFLGFYPDADIRWIFYNLLSNAIAIFLAILINTTIFKFLTDELVENQPPFGLGLQVSARVHFAIRFVMFLCSFTFLNICASCCRSTKSLFMVSSMGEHLFAFAGIGAFFKIQEAINIHSGLDQKLKGLLMIIVGVTARLVCMMLFAASAWMRTRLHSRMSTDAADTITDRCVEAENQGNITLVSFLYIQGILVFFTGLFLPVNIAAHAEIYLEEDAMHVASAVFIVGCGAVVCHLCVGVLKRYACAGADESSRHLNNLAEVPGMSISWCFLRTSVLIATHWFPFHKVCALVVNATLIYTVSMIISLVLDKVADHHTEQIKEQERTLTLDLGERAASGRIDTGGIGAIFTDHFAHHVAENARSTIRYLSLLVGLCWEKAWDEADELILEAHVVRRNPLFAQVALAVVMTVWTGTAWYQYIVRMAILSLNEHEVRIANEKREADGFMFDQDYMDGMDSESGSSEE